MARSRWNLLPLIPEQHSLTKSGFSPLIAQLLYNRGITEQSQLESFIASDASLSADPFLMPGMHQAVARIYQALLSGENMAIYGDFDTDGITATALLVQGLSMLDGKVTPYIPHRLSEGYGLQTAALEILYRQGISLVISVDCGITALPQVKRAQKIGLDVIITDHHTPLETLPAAIAVLNPKLPGSNYPFSELAGVGVALKLLQALFRSIGKERQLETLADLAALGTIADMSPLLGENRYLVKQGLKQLSASPRLGIREILNRAGINNGDIDSECISWNIAPRLNAAGRLEHAMSSYRLLMTESAEEARELANFLEETNAERQKLTRRVQADAREQVLQQADAPLLTASGKDYPAGIVGLVAGRLSEEFYRPAIVICTGEQTSTGSCRSISEFNIIQALNQHSHLLSYFGGHSRAAGFSLPTRNLPRLLRELSQMAGEQLAGVDLRARLDIDAEVSLSTLNGDTFPMMQKLAPFGQGNPVPTFLSRNVGVAEHRTMGGNGEHLRLKLRQGSATWNGVGFNLGSYLSGTDCPLDIVYNLEIDRWNGEERLRLNILDLAPSG